MRPVSVSQLNNYIKRTLASDPILSNVTVRGEISKLTFHGSGHVYFTLKDESSRLNCFLAADRVPLLRFELDEGMEILASGSISVYERGGYYSLNIRDIEAAGEGALNAAFEKLKEKLQKEGLFDESLKRPLPEFPRRIGVVTSPTGAAVHDIVSTVKRRNPLVDLVIYPCLVQGPGAAAGICEGIRAMNLRYPDLDILIVGMGGGSKEDLWSFNEEPVARAVRASKIPVISAVGHEVDVTICDMAADVRGATPTAAAELAVPHIDVYRDAMRMASPERLGALLRSGIESYSVRADSARQLCRTSLENLVDSRRQRADRAIELIRSSAADTVAQRSMKLQLIKSVLDGAGPMEILKRGYAAVKDENGAWITTAKDARKAEALDLMFEDGAVRVRPEGREKA
ncbi:MAG: exodeoxyribonuclease VII large subunit [Firmicutes bacterium]|nr:exodeoxyribonuclease VII large subunit [Bacillota bacterium]